MKLLFMIKFNKIYDIEKYVYKLITIYIVNTLYNITYLCIYNIYYVFNKLNI
jgi:hypothetical protein